MCYYVSGSDGRVGMCVVNRFSCCRCPLPQRFSTLWLCLFRRCGWDTIRKLLLKFVVSHILLYISYLLCSVKCVFWVLYWVGHLACKYLVPKIPRDSLYHYNLCWTCKVPVWWLSGRTSLSDRQTFTGLHRACSWWVTIYMGKPSAIGQPTRPTQPFILTGSINE